MLTGALSLLALAALAVVASYGVHQLAPGLGRTIAVLGLLGGLGLLAGGWFASLERRSIYEDIIVAGFRHVHAPRSGPAGRGARGRHKQASPGQRT